MHLQHRLPFRIVKALGPASDTITIEYSSKKPLKLQVRVSIIVVLQYRGRSCKSMVIFFIDPISIQCKDIACIL
jgi:hypothetical protein